MERLHSFMARLADRLPFQVAANRWRDAADWEDARSRARGYGDREIVAKVVAATRMVAEDPDAWERDSVVFRGRDPHWQILSSLLLAWTDADSAFHVVDFGGSLGSLWWRHRTLLAGRGKILWTVVEQPSFVAAGAEFGGEHLRFSESMPEGGADLVIASCVLNYLETPYARLEMFADSGADWLLLDRIPLVESPADRAMVQSVHPRIYSASYPCWFFSRERFNTAVAKSWSPVARWRERLRSRPDVEWAGGLYRRNHQQESGEA